MLFVYDSLCCFYHLSALLYQHYCPPMVLFASEELLYDPNLFRFPALLSCVQINNIQLIQLINDLLLFCLQPFLILPLISKWAFSLYFLYLGNIATFYVNSIEISASIVNMFSNNSNMNTQRCVPTNHHNNLIFNPQPQPNMTKVHLFSAQQNMNRLDRPMYSSTIHTSSTQATLHNGIQAFGPLGNMGRLVKEEVEEATHQVKANSVGAHQQNQQIKPLTFRRDPNPKVKMAASSIFTSNSTQNSTFLKVTAHNENNVALSKLSAWMTSKKIVEVQEQEMGSQSEDNRKRQILSFKLDGDLLNKKIENTFGAFDANKKEGENKPYFQLSTRKKQNQQLNQPSKSAYPAFEPAQKSISGQQEQNKQVVLTQINVNQAQFGSFDYKLPISKQTQGMFKKKNPYLNEPQPLIKTLPVKSEKITRKFTKSDFIIGKKMGKGQFGEVMMVIHKQTGFLCAMKVMSKKQIRQEKYVNQIARELSIQFYLSHRYIAPLYGYFQDENHVYLLVQFCADGQLLQKMRKAHRLEDAQTSPIIREVCEGLDYIHREQILHRDIKPENILFQFGTVKISDFGWAVYSGNEMRRTVSGTPLYYSPQLVLENAYDEKIDIWSIGMMTYECLLGKIPFRIYSQFDLKRIVEDEITFPDYVDVSDEAKDFILKVMKKSPEDRMQIREMVRHPFISNYLKEKKVNETCLSDIRRILNG